MNIKKIICSVLCVLLAGALLTGCGDALSEANLMRKKVKFEKQITDQWAQAQRENPAEPPAVTDMDKTEVTEELLACLSGKDAEGLKAMLCLRDQEMDDIDEQIADAFDFFSGNVLSYDDDLSGSEGDSRDYGIKTSHDRRWFVEDIQTDTGEVYDITIHQYLVSYTVTGREGIVQINIGNGGSEVVIGYAWTDYKAWGHSYPSKVLDAIQEQAYSTLYCDKTTDMPNIREQIAAAADFIDGEPRYAREGQVVSGLWDIWPRVVQEEYVQNHAPSVVYLEIYAENIHIGEEGVFSMEIYLYHLNTEDAALEGVMKVVLHDETGNTCTIGENFHNT